MKGAAEMKKLKKRSGFTLVECVVAMAVLAIMSMLLTMVLNVALRQRNINMEQERELDKQVNEIVIGDVTEEGMSQEIVFKQDGEEVEKIPGNGVDNIDANKIYNEDNESELDALKYDFSNYTKFEDIANGGTPDGGEPENTSSKVYGASDIVNVGGKQPVYLNATVADGADGTKVIKLNVRFDVASINKNQDGKVVGESAVKVVLPSSATDVSSAAVMNSTTLPISKKIVRIEPADVGTVEANITFTISDKDYTDNYKNVSYWFTGVDSAGNSVIAYLNE